MAESQDKKTYLIYATLSFEVDAEHEDAAKEQAGVKLAEIEKLGASVTDAKVADRKTGYFVK